MTTQRSSIPSTEQGGSAPGPPEEHVPVLVVGGSLVGLSMSLFLGRLGVRHLVVERRADHSTHPRGRGNNVRTMELFRVAGVEAAVREAAAGLADNHGILQTRTLAEEGGWLFRNLDPDGRLARVSPSGWCLCSQNDLEPVLVRHARELGADVRFGAEAVSFTQDADGVSVLVRDGDGEQPRTIRARYLVAADGPRSPVRTSLGIGHTGAGELFHNVSVTFRAPGLAQIVGNRRFIVCYLTDPVGEGALLPVDNRENWVFHAPWHPERGESLADFTDERLFRQIRAAAGDEDLDVEVTGLAPWHAAERVAERYRDGRVFLAGDSAHEMSPTGAFGSNTGIQDAHNLAWKLAAVLGGWAGPGLLDSYEAERRPVAVATAERASDRSAEHSHPGYTPSDATPGAERPGGVMPAVLGQRYPRGAVVGADPAGAAVPPAFRPVAEPGARAPHVWMRRAGAGGGRVSTLDLFERRPVLLCAAEARAWAEAGQRAARALEVPLEVLSVGPGRDLEEDGGTDWEEPYRLSPEGAVLVRPDGFVAWHAAKADPEAEAVLSEALRTVLDLDAR